MDGASIKQIGIASALRSLFKGTKHYIYKDLCDITHSGDKNPEYTNPYADYMLKYRQNIDDKLYYYNKLLGNQGRIGDEWFEKTTIDNYNSSRSSSYGRHHSLTFSPLRRYRRYHSPRRTFSPSRYRYRYRSRSRSRSERKRKRSSSLSHSFRGSPKKRKYNN